MKLIDNNEPLVYQRCILHVTEVPAASLSEEVANGLKKYDEIDVLVISNIPEETDKDVLKTFLTTKFKEEKANMYIESIQIFGDKAEVRLNNNRQGELRLGFIHPANKKRRVLFKARTL